MPSAAVTAVQRQRWATGKHVGSARPALRAFVRKGALHRHYAPLPDADVFSYVPGLRGPNWVWYSEWKAQTDYVEVPNIKEVKGDQDYDQNGVQQVTMTIDNIGMIEEEGPMGALFHQIERGYYAPQRGNKPPVTGGERVASKNDWFDQWKDKSTQVMIVGGYGEAVFPLFLGLVDNVQLTSSPDQIVVTLRDMGQFLTDQHTFMDAKNLFIKDPITFCDREKADERHNEATTAFAKTEKPGNPARFAVDGSKDSAWLSGAHPGPQGLEYIDIPIPAGRYEDFTLNAAYAGMTCFVSVFATNDNVPQGGSARGTDGTVYGEGWINAKTGLGVVDEGIHATASLTPKQGSTNYPILRGGGGFLVGDGSKVRFWFTDLCRTAADDRKGYVYRAGVATVEVFSRNRDPAVRTEHWILVDDVSDIVKTVLQWVGLTEWEVETCGVRLKDKIVFDRQTFLIDIIKHIAELTSYVFFIRPPLDFDAEDLSADNEANLSMGIAVFRQGSAMQREPRDGARVEVIKDTTLLTAVQATFDANQLPNSVRVRGKPVSAKEASPNVHVLGADPSVRYQYSYRPPWARSGANASGGNLRRHEVHYDNLLRSVYECKVAALFIAFRSALEASKAEVEFPFWPGIFLDDQVLLYDTGTGLSTRLWVTTRSWNYSSGEAVSFKLNLGGALLDVNDVAEVQKELEGVLAEDGRNPGKIARGPWEQVHRF